MAALPPEEWIALAGIAAQRSPEPMVWVDPQGDIVFANAAAGHSFGGEADALTGRSFFDFAPEMNAELWRELWRELRSRHLFSFEFALKASADRILEAEMTAHHAAAGPREFAVLFFRDNQTQKRLERLQQEFVSTVSHELRSPMTLIREGIAQVHDGLRGGVTDSQKRALSIALTGIDRLGRIIDELLDMSRIEAGKIVLQRVRVDLAQLARETAGDFETTAQDRGLELRVSAPVNPLWVYADRDRILQVVHNLVANAFKFTERGRIEVVVSARENELICAVEDTGIGMTAEECGRAFHKFEQLGRAAVTGEKGTGLGLSICEGLVTLHQGRVWAESDGPGRGSRLAFSLPRQSAVDVFREQLRGLIKEVAARSGSLSALTFSIVDRGRPGEGREEIEQAMEGLENLVRHHRGRRTDLMVKGETTVYLALPSTVKREAVRVAERIVRGFEDALRRENIKRPLHMDYQACGFPEDAAREEDFIDRACPNPAP